MERAAFYISCNRHDCQNLLFQMEVDGAEDDMEKNPGNVEIYVKEIVAIINIALKKQIYLFDTALIMTNT